MRIARVHIPGVVHHLIWRFVDRDYFIEDQLERDCYVRLLGHALSSSDWLCLAYAIMSNHIHMALVAGEEPCSDWSRRVNSPFAQWMNERHGRLGPLFADRPRDRALSKISEWAVVGYIHNNPVRAGVVPTASASRWTSHRAYLGLENAPAWLHVDAGMAYCGVSDAASFDLYARGAPTLPKEIDIGRTLAAIRSRGALHVGTPGDASFPIMTHPGARIRIAPENVVEVVARECGVGVAQLASRRRLPTLTVARSIVAKLAEQNGITSSALANTLGLSRQAVSKLARRRVDETLFERCVSRLRIAG